MPEHAAGVVHQHVEPIEFREHVVGEPAYVGLPREIAEQRGDLRTWCAATNLLEAARRLAGVAPDHHHLGALLRQAARGFQADSARGARHEHPLASDVPGHARAIADRALPRQQSDSESHPSQGTPEMPLRRPCYLTMGASSTTRISRSRSSTR